MIINSLKLYNNENFVPDLEMLLYHELEPTTFPSDPEELFQIYRHRRISQDQQR